MLKPNGKLAFYDVIAADGGELPHYPVPWAATAETSTLLTEAQTRTALEGSGFRIIRWEDVTQEAFGWMSAQQAAPPLAVGPGVVVGQRMVEMVGNFGRNLKHGRTRLVIGVAV